MRIENIEKVQMLICKLDNLKHTLKVLNGDDVKLTVTSHSVCQRAHGFISSQEDEIGFELSNKKYLEPIKKDIQNKIKQIENELILL